MENQPIQPPEKTAKISDGTQTAGKNNISTEIEDLGEDLLYNVLGRLPALTFASASCVSRLWNSLCKSLLSSPKLASAVSFNPSLETAVEEVVDKVLSGPIQPHFALASISPSFSLEQVYHLIAKKLGTEIPLVTSVSEGLIGRDLHTNDFVEVQWEITDEGDSENSPVLGIADVNPGIMLTIGFLPGLKAYTVPLLMREKRCMRSAVPEDLLIDEFLMDIRRHTSVVSDTEYPAGILFFTDCETDVKPVLQKMEYAFSPETAIVGAVYSKLLYNSKNLPSTTVRRRATSVATALLFVRDKNKLSGTGQTNFHVMVSTGLAPVGLTYKASAVKCYPKLTSLTASKESLHEHLDGQTILEEVYDELGDRIQYPTFYIGVTKTRKCSIGRENVRRMQYLEFHEVSGGDEEYLYVHSAGIKTGDPFRFYITNSKAAVQSCENVSANLKRLKEDWEQKHGAPKSEVFGGIIFSCCGRGEPLFGKRGIDSSPFLDNFPGVTFGGSYCTGEIGRTKLSLYDPNYEGGESISCCEHCYSASYLVLSYSPPPPMQH